MSDPKFGWDYPPGVTDRDFEDPPSDECETCNGYGYTLSVDRTGGSPDGYWKTPCPDCGEDDEE